MGRGQERQAATTATASRGRRDPNWWSFEWSQRPFDRTHKAEWLSGGTLLLDGRPATIDELPGAYDGLIGPSVRARVAAYRPRIAKPGEIMWHLTRPRAVKEIIRSGLEARVPVISNRKRGNARGVYLFSSLDAARRANMNWPERLTFLTVDLAGFELWPDPRLIDEGDSFVIRHDISAERIQVLG